MTSVPMFNLSNVTDVEKLMEIASSVLTSSQHILGQNVTYFERVFAEQYVKKVENKKQQLNG
jgi:hypothetical protein